MSKTRRQLEGLKADRAWTERKLVEAIDHLPMHAHWLAKLNALDREIANLEARL